MEAELIHFISAGFVITRPANRPGHVSAGLLPDQVLSACGCIGSFLPDTWCIEWTGETPESRTEKARTFGLDDSALARLTTYVTARFGDSIGWPNILFDLHAAGDLAKTFLTHLPDVKVLELGVHRNNMEVLCRAAEPPPAQPGYSPNGRQGVHEAVLKDRPVTDGGSVLGFEPLVFDHSLSCSWLCNSLDSLVAETLGIGTNPFGLIESFADARRCVEYISRDDVGAEPGLWLPWLMINHTEKAFKG